ncbi:MAG TPA: cobalamin-binding protein [Methanosarcinaceae archaeon]|nr:cobalamin-binding protein [Methanosarcinaceae archaeon]
MWSEEMLMPIPKTSYIVLLILTTLLISNGQAYPINITDNFGCDVTIEKAPERIISLSPCNTEILFAVGAGNRVVGGTTYDQYPQEAVNLPKIGGFSTINIEAVVNLTPDLILAEYGNGEDTINALKNLNLTVVSLNPKTMDDILDNIRLVGNITGNADTAALITTDMTQQIKDMTSQTETLSLDQRPRVLYLVWHDPMYAAGAGSYPNDLIWMAGGNNIIEAEGWPTISLEQVVNKNPQIIICSGMGGGSYTIMEAITSDPILAQTDAVRNQKVYAIADPNIIELAGPRIIHGLEELHSYIAPEIKPHGTGADDQENTYQLSGFGMLLAASMVLAVYSMRKL